MVFVCSKSRDDNHALPAFFKKDYYSTMEKSYFVHVPWKFPQFLGDTFQLKLKKGLTIPKAFADAEETMLAAGIPAVPKPVTTAALKPCTLIELYVEAEDNSDPEPSTLIAVGYPVITASFKVSLPFLLMWIPFS